MDRSAPPSTCTRGTKCLSTNFMDSCVTNGSLMDRIVISSELLSHVGGKTETSWSSWSVIHEITSKEVETSSTSNSFIPRCHELT